ncbi:expansin-B15-like precursor [Olea europaea subsp. europaea]|uniref:Expansin-B15-like n=1 Tax=Olea europaea subsp. europaea TaxID=158383 RepID=A0A8S0TJB9_OLEEU|nr:expansin-B15-like precursor [Olea europaea subsp. europaea]
MKPNGRGRSGDVCPELNQKYKDAIEALEGDIIFECSLKHSDYGKPLDEGSLNGKLLARYNDGNPISGYDQPGSMVLEMKRGVEIDGRCLLQDGEGKECGACYKIKRTKHHSCSGKPEKVVITDFCPGGPCASESAHFDLRGAAFGSMAIPGKEDKLRDAGVLQIRYSRVACDYSGKTIMFRVDQGSNPEYFMVMIEFEEGDGDLARVDLQQASSKPGEWFDWASAKEEHLLLGTITLCFLLADKRLLLS